MQQPRWSQLIAEIAAVSGVRWEAELSDATVAGLEEVASIVVPEPRRRYMKSLPEVEFDEGLTDSEIEAVQERFGFRFPPDLREFLQTALPEGERFPDWRRASETDLRNWLAEPVEGICFDVEHNGFWLHEWGQRPERMAEALQKCRELVAAAPKLIPVWAHRFMPDEPHLSGNPVFSVHQTDIIYFGHDLADYLRREFDFDVPALQQETLRPIRFWDLDRFLDVRWSGGPVKTDPRTLPPEWRGTKGQKEAP